MAQVAGSDQAVTEAIMYGIQYNVKAKQDTEAAPKASGCEPTLRFKRGFVKQVSLRPPTILVSVWWDLVYEPCFAIFKLKKHTFPEGQG